jgi:hypothetical protein
VDQRAFERTIEQLLVAARKLDAMKTAQDIRELSSHWSELLVAVQRTFTKLRKATERGAAKGWFDAIQSLRHTDELLSYVRHARNADEHGIDLITHIEPGGIGIGPKHGNTMIIGHMVIDGGKIMVDAETAQNMKVSFFPGMVRLVAVKDRGRCCRGGGSRRPLSDRRTVSRLRSGPGLLSGILPAQI